MIIGNFVLIMMMNNDQLYILRIFLLNESLQVSFSWLIVLGRSSLTSLLSECWVDSTRASGKGDFNFGLKSCLFD